MSGDWWQTFFDEDYLHIFQGFLPERRSDAEAQGLWDLLGLKEGSRVLDAPCGWGRIAKRIAARGAVVLGVDQSAAMIARAENDRGDVPPGRLRYRVHDLRVRLSETGFDAAYNIFSSIGYGTEDDDRNILRTLRKAVRPGGVVLVDTSHRDLAVTFFARGGVNAMRLDDGTLVLEQPVFDAIAGRVNTTWHWSGPRGSGSRSASLRAYSATELVRLIEAAGLRYVSAHKGCSPEPFKGAGPDMGGRLAILARRED
jgi:SAM-dependent methyltransferase